MKIIFFLHGAVSLQGTSVQSRNQGTHNSVGTFAAYVGKSNNVKLVEADCRIERDFTDFDFDQLPSNTELRNISTRKEQQTRSWHKLPLAEKIAAHARDWCHLLEAKGFRVEVN